MKWLGLVVAAASTAVTLAACSSTDPDKYPSSDAFCSAKAGEECKAAGYCGTNTDACKRQRTQICSQAAAQAVGAGRAYRASNAEDCINKTHNLFANPSFTPAAKADAEYACGKVFKGNVQTNGQCTLDFDCSGELVCDKGRCASKTTKKLNEPCANPGEVCDATTFCAKDGSGLVVCQAKHKQGETCSTSTDAPVACVDTTRCAGTGFCEARVPQGGACDVGADQCAAEAPYCDDTTKKCVTQIIFAPTQTELCKQFGG